MNQLQAMRDTIEFMDEALDPDSADTGAARQASDEQFVGFDPSLRPSHLRDMLTTMESNDNPQHPGEPMGEAKMGRWLGWAQAAVVAMGCATLDDMKIINKRNAEPTND